MSVLYPLSTGRPFSRPRPALYKALSCFFIKSLHFLSCCYLNCLLSKMIFATIRTNGMFCTAPPYSPRAGAGKPLLKRLARLANFSRQPLQNVSNAFYHKSFPLPLLPEPPRRAYFPRRLLLFKSYIFAAAHSLRADTISKKFVFIISFLVGCSKL